MGSPTTTEKAGERFPQKIRYSQYRINSGQGNLATQLMGVDLSSSPSMPQSPNPSSLRPGPPPPGGPPPSSTSSLPPGTGPDAFSQPPGLVPPGPDRYPNYPQPPSHGPPYPTTTVLCLALLVFPLVARPGPPSPSVSPDPSSVLPPPPNQRLMCLRLSLCRGWSPILR
eukprot:g75671.t1